MIVMTIKLQQRSNHQGHYVWSNSFPGYVPFTASLNTFEKKFIVLIVDLSVTNGCVMNMNQGHIFYVKVIEHFVKNLCSVHNFSILTWILLYYTQLLPMTTALSFPCTRSNFQGHSLCMLKILVQSIPGFLEYFIISVVSSWGF